MKSEDPKQADQEAKSPEGQEQQGKSDGLAANSTEEQAARGKAGSGTDGVTEDRWNDSDINAAVDVLERPSQIPVSVRGSNTNPGEADEHASLLDRHSGTLAASAVEKSKRTGSEPPNSVGSQPPQCRAAEVETCVETDGAAVVSPAKGVASEASGDSPVVAGVDDEEQEEPTAYFDRTLGPAEPESKPKTLLGAAASFDRRVPAVETSLAVGKASGMKSLPRAPSPTVKALESRVAEAKTSSTAGNPSGATQAVAPPGHGTGKGRVPLSGSDSEESEEPTLYFDRSALSKSNKAQDETEEATQFYDRQSMSQPGADSPEETEEPTQYFERQNAAVVKQDRPITLASLNAEVKALLAPAFASDVAGRQSSVSLGIGVALLSAETTEPPPVVGQKPILSSSPPQSKISPPRPAGTRSAERLAQPEFERAPLSVPTGEIPTRLVQEGKVRPTQTGTGAELGAAASAFAQSPGLGPSASGDAEPMSERFHEAPGGEIEPPAQGLTGITAFSIAPRPGSAGFEEEVWLDPIVVRLGRRLLRVAAGCVLAGLVLAWLDARYAQSAAVNHPTLWQLVLACAGLVMPMALVLAVFVTVLSMLLHPDSAPSLLRLPQKLRPLDIRRQARLAVILGVTPLAISSWLLLVARAALPLLGSNAASPVVGTLLAAMSVGLGLLVAAPVLAVARYVGVRLRQTPPDPVRWGLVGALLGIVPLAVAVATGPTSGAGSAFAIFGVFKRPELDLRAPCMLLMMALSGYLLPSRLRAMRWPWLVLIVLLPLGLTVRAATRGLDSRDVALALERSAPLSRMALGALRRATDRDRDGFSQYFGGGDCDEQDRRRNPGADDVPQNGIDEDCSGSDASDVKLKSAPVPPVELLRARRGVIPADLNLILIIVDTMRADTLHHAKRVTPRLDELADKSVTVQQAYAPASYTGKSVGPILIGKHSSETHRDFGHFAAFSKKDTFLQQRLRAAGIRTLSVQAYWYFFHSIYGFDRGFDVVDSNASVSAGYVEGDRSTTGEKLTERILWQLDQAENTSGRFFLWTQYTDPHAEYVSHEGFDLGSDSMGKYHGEVAFVDYHVGRIIDFVKSKPWGARTAIVVTSDHGEAFSEHGMIRHGFELWEPLVRVPLVVQIPGVEPRQVRARRSLIDLAPTILDLMQTEIPDGSGSDFLSGRSLLPELLGIEGSDASRPLLVDMANGPFTAERQAYIDGDIKLLTAAGRPIGLFDLSSDPEEKKDLLDNTELRERIVGEYRAYKKAMRTIEVRAPKQ